ncbi:glycosyl transferase family 1 [Mycobacterium sp. IS-1590]|uniref:glycosyltransferase n=1 Tax=Mycobacterium sp. IS-1590 TaxID=1772286 RepID=UPI0007494A99|nr:glycosyltransferase [Mycobacterium sp. IS-1590]KUI42162.1 glycosyl transferase family 1 [Mycobacterium sp. IS-1590]
MKFVLATYGTRGDIEPSVAIGRELLRRGHEVHMAVPPDLVGFAESAGLTAVAYGLETQAWLDAYRNFWTAVFRNFWNIPELRRLWPELWEPLTRCWQEITTTLTGLADGADLLFTGLSFQQAAANVAEYHDIPLATLHYLPVQANGRLLPFLPGPLGRSAMRLYDWMSWRMDKKLEDGQRQELGLPKATRPASGRIAERGWLEIQAYDEACFPGLAAEWAKWDGQRPFVGALTLELPTEADEEVTSWIDAGTPPIFFGFGSMPVESPGDMIAMIGAACARLGERALIGAGWSDFSDVPAFEHVKVVGTVNFATIFPACRAVVHHGGAGTTAIGLRAGIPTLILSMDVNQTLWGVQVKRLKVGAARRFSSTTQDSLVQDLRTILAPEYAARARELAARMSTPAESVVAAADHVEKAARPRGVG